MYAVYWGMQDSCKSWEACGMFIESYEGEVVEVPIEEMMIGPVIGGVVEVMVIMIMIDIMMMNRQRQKAHCMVTDQCIRINLLSMWGGGNLT
jgi:hypothetical protein